MIPQSYKEYLVYFHGPRDYFECHEVLEEYWKEAPSDKREEIWVGLIQIAVALYHQRLGNFRGANRLLKNAISLIKKNEKKVNQLGLDYDQLVNLLTIRLQAIQKEERYTSMNFPIVDESLLSECKEECKNQGFTWGQPSDLSKESIIRKHTLRDRTDVIEEREIQKQKRKKDR